MYSVLIEKGLHLYLVRPLSLHSLDDKSFRYATFGKKKKKRGRWKETIQIERKIGKNIRQSKKFQEKKKKTSVNRFELKFKRKKKVRNWKEMDSIITMSA